MAREEWKREAKLRGICGDLVVCLLGSKAWEPLREDCSAAYAGKSSAWRRQCWRRCCSVRGGGPSWTGGKSPGVRWVLQTGKGVQARAGGLKGPWRVLSGNFPTLISPPLFPSPVSSSQGNICVHYLP